MTACNPTDGRAARTRRSRGNLRSNRGKTRLALRGTRELSQKNSGSSVSLIWRYRTRAGTRSRVSGHGHGTRERCPRRASSEGCGTPSSNASSPLRLPSPPVNFPSALYFLSFATAHTSKIARGTESANARPSCILQRDALAMMRGRTGKRFGISQTAASKCSPEPRGPGRKERGEWKSDGEASEKCK